MASFTDKLVEFNPYIQQIPVDDYLRVGMAKQQQYEQGVQKVQSYIDSVRGLEVAKDVHKEYVDTSLRNLKSEVSKVVGADFASQQLQGQIGSLTSRITSDPIIQNAVLSTQRYKQGLTEMQKAKQEGKSNVVNDWKYQSQAQAWLQDGDAKSSFSGQYIPYTDYNKKMMETIHKLVPKSKLTQIPFKRNGDGTPLVVNGRPVVDEAMLEVLDEGVDPTTIRRAIELSLNENDINQINMEGQYHYRNHDPIAMKGVVDENYRARIERANDRLEELQVNKKLNIKDSEYQSKIDSEIKAIKDGAENISKGYKKDIENLSANPEGFKSQFYTHNYFDQVAHTFATSKQSYKYLENHYKNQINKDRDFNLAYNKAIHDMNMDKLNYELNSEKLLLEKRKARKEDEDAGSLMITGNIATGEAEQMHSKDWQDQIKAQEDGLVARKNDVISKDDTLSKLPREKAEAELLRLKDSWSKGGPKGEITPLLDKYFRETEAATQQIANKRQVLVDINTELNRNPDLKINPKEAYRLIMGNKTYEVGELLSINDKIGKVTYNSPYSGEGVPLTTLLDEKEAEKIMTPKELELFKIYKKSADGKKLSVGEQKAYDQLFRVRSVSPNLKATVQKRDNLLTEKLTTLVNEFQPENYLIKASKPESLERAKFITSSLLQNAENRKESVGYSPNFDYNEAVAALANKETVFGIHKQGDETYVTLSASPKSKTQYIPISRSQLNEINGGEFDRPFDPITNAIKMSGGKTTNIQGKGHETSYFKKTNFPNVTKYGVKADIEAIGGDSYQLKLYIYNPSTSNWEERVPYREFTDKAELLDAIRNIGDRTISDILTPPKKQE